MRSFSFKLLVGAVAAMAALGCSDERFGELAVIAGAPVFDGSEPQPTEQTVEGAITALAGHGVGVVVGTDSGAHAADAEGLLPLEVWSDDPAVSPDPGAVALLARADNTVLLLSTPAGAEQGLFHTFGDKLIPSPATDSFAELTIFALDSHSDSEMWLATSDGVLRLLDGKLEEIALGEQAGPADAVLRQGELVYAAMGDEVYEIDLVDGEAYLVPYDMGAVRQIVAGAAGSVYFVSDRGVFERTADGQYTHYDFGAGSGAVVHGASYYPKDGLFVMTDAGVSLLVSGQPPMGAMELAGTGVRPLTVDDVGRAWVGDGASLFSAPLGTPISFETDVAPILVNHCASCHAEGDQGAPVQPFDDYNTANALGATIVERIASGQMPPAGSPTVSADDFDIIYRWLLSGQNP